MTTVAYKDGVMCADTQASDGPGLKSTAHKMWENSNIVVGFSGHYAEGVLFMRKYLKDETTIASLADVGDISENLWLMAVDRKTKAIYRSDGKVLLPYTDHYFYAIGSGRDFALAAMALGQTAAQAVSLAHEFDLHTGPHANIIIL